MLPEWRLERRPGWLEEAEEESREGEEEGQGLGQVDSLSALLLVLGHTTSPHTRWLRPPTLTGSQSPGIRTPAVLSWGLLPEPLRRLGLLTTPRQDLLHLEPELT